MKRIWDDHLDREIKSNVFSLVSSSLKSSFGMESATAGLAVRVLESVVSQIA